MDDLNSYSGFLDKVRQFDLLTDSSEQWEKQIEQGKYYKYYREAKPGVYVLDFTSQRYVYVNNSMASFADHSIPDMMSGGLNLALKLWHPDDLKVYDQHILPVNLRFLKNKSVAEYSNLLFTCNYRVRQRKGNYLKIEQTSFFSKSLDDGLPLMTIGFLRDITNRVFDNSIIHTIEEIGTYSNKLLYQKLLNPDEGSTTLTFREIEILELIVKGKNSNQIANELGIEKNTVDNHRKNMLKKTNSTNMVQVALLAYKSGVIK